MTKRTSHRASERGAALVEMALIMPLIVLMLFGMIEASWAFAQANDVKHGAREGARIAAIDYGDATAIANEVCDRMDIVGGAVTVAVSDGSGGADDGARGSEGRIVVTLAYTSLTGVLNTWFGGYNLTSDINFIVEQPLTGEAAWWNGGAGGSASC